MVDKSVVATVKNYLNALKSNRFKVRFGVLFGSQASGTAHEWSDIDRIWWIAAETDSRIEPLPCGEKQWREDDVSTIIEIARREGQLVTLSEDA